MHNFANERMKTIQMPYRQLGEAIGLSHDIYLKREDQHKYGSHKGRSIPFMIKKYFKSEDNIRTFVISSSGNAAIAAVHAVQQHNKNNPGREITLDVFVGMKLNEKKKSTLEKLINDDRITLSQVERPKQEAIQRGQQEDVINLRQSTDDTALEGYWELAKEIAKIPNLKAVFIPTSSGTTAQAIGQTFEELGVEGIQIHIVQTTSCHPMAETFDSADNKDFSVAGAIVDHVAHRKEATITQVQRTGGHGWIVTNEQIKQARKVTRDITNVDPSTNAALSIAGAQKAMANGWNWDGPIMCVITGQ